MARPHVISATSLRCWWKPSISEVLNSLHATVNINFAHLLHSVHFQSKDSALASMGSNLPCTFNVTEKNFKILPAHMLTFADAADAERYIM
jgi:hypothetical protein